MEKALNTFRTIQEVIVVLLQWKIDWREVNNKVSMIYAAQSFSSYSDINTERLILSHRRLVYFPDLASVSHKVEK